MIKDGEVYLFVCRCNLGLVIYSDADNSPQPLRGLPPEDLDPTPIEIKQVDGDKYKLISISCPGQVVATPREGSPKWIMLAPEGESYYTEWIIEPSDSNYYKIRAANLQGDEYWNLEGNGSGIILQGFRGLETQQWELKPINEEE